MEFVQSHLNKWRRGSVLVLHCALRLLYECSTCEKQGLHVGFQSTSAQTCGTFAVGECCHEYTRT